MLPSRLTFLVPVVATLLLVPTVQARSESHDYVTANGAIIIYSHNYYVVDWDVGGDRFSVLPGETAAKFSLSGGPATALVDFTTAANVVLSSRIFCGNQVSVPIPANARFAHVYVGSDASYPAALYPDAPTCGVLVPPAAGTITGEFN